MKSQETINALNEEHFNDIKETLKQILEQTKRTNGRVTSLEMSRSYMYGALAIMTTLILPLVFIVFKTWID